MKKIHLLGLMLFTVLTVNAQEKNDAPKVILITIDGLRWQEIFSGADKNLITDNNYVKNKKELKETFWKSSPKERRKALMPFLWNKVEKTGQLHGNRTLGSKMNLTNKHWFSYPGYNEILTGASDDLRINSNKKIENPNVTILETVNMTAKFNGKVAAFGSWDVFPFIINEQRSGVPTNAGYENATGTTLSKEEILLNKLQNTIPKEWSSVRFDAFTHNYALEYMKEETPNLVYIAYGETDDFAHDGDYEQYLKSANTTDQFIKEIWGFVNTNKFYKGNTTIIITTDHGRGTVPTDSWRSHGKDINGADQVWLVAFGNQVAALGEIKVKEQIYSNQIAASIAKLLSVKTSETPIGKSLDFFKYNME